MEKLAKPARRALVVTPHPDDAEGGVGGTMAKWVREADTQFMVVMCTNGDKGTSDPEMTPEKLAVTREAEQRDASRVLGVQDVVFLAYPDGRLEDTLEFRGKVVQLIRSYKPDAVFCIDPFRSVSHTHRDHRMSGQVAVDAAYTYAWSYQYFPEQLAQDGLMPHHVENIYLWGSESPDVYVNIDGYLELKAESLSMHASQMRNRTQDQRLERIKSWSSEAGKKAGVPYAEGFRHIPLDLGSQEWYFWGT